MFGNTVEIIIINNYMNFCPKKSEKEYLTE